jgi:hypothetical protein
MNMGSRGQALQASDAALKAPAPTPAPQVKALGVKSFVDAIKKRAGTEEFARFLGALSPAARTVVDNPPPAQAWLPISVELELIQQALTHAFSGDLGKLRAASADSATQDFTSAYRIFIKLLSPMFLIKRVGIVWSMLYRDNGSLEITKLDEAGREVHFRVTAAAAMPAVWWEFLIAGIEAVVLLTRIENPRVFATGGGGHERFLDFCCRW